MRYGCSSTVQWHVNANQSVVERAQRGGQNPSTSRISRRKLKYPHLTLSPAEVEAEAEAQVELKAEPQHTLAEAETERQTLLFHPHTPTLARNSAAVDASKI